jgi:hypothetical protein
MIRFVFIVFIVIHFSSCNNNSISTEEFVKQVEQDDIYNQVIEKGEIIYSCRYLPPEYMALKNFSPEDVLNGKVNKEIFKKATEEYSRGKYFQLRISRKDGTEISKSLVNNLKDYGRLQEYFTNGMLKDFFAEAKDKNITAINYQYNRTYGVSPFVDFVYVFPDKLPENSIFYYNDRLHSYDLPEKIAFEFDFAETQGAILLKEIR